jgi:cytoskeleton protein RodZ
MSAADDMGIFAAGARDSATPGARLSQARQAQNLAPGDIARRLKLSVWQIEALEAGRYHELPGPIFVRGFIRNYARLLKLDAEELVHAAAGSLPQQEPSPEMPPSRDIPFPSGTAPRWPQFIAGAAVIVGLLAIYEFFFDDAPRNVAPQPAVEAPVRTVEAGEPNLAPVISAPIARHAPSESPASAPPQQEARAADPAEREVSLIFDEESWVEIRDRNDKPIFAQLNSAGTVRRVSGVPPLSVVVGNALGVRMTYAGRPIDLARYTKIDVARLTLE